MFDRWKRWKRRRNGTDDSSAPASVPSPSESIEIARDVDDEDGENPVAGRDDVTDAAGVRDLLSSGDRLGFDPEVVVFDRRD